MRLIKINKDGFYIEDIILEPTTETIDGKTVVNPIIIPSDCVEIQPQQGLYKAKWTGTEWVEGWTAEEITDFLTPKSTKDSLKEQLASTDSGMARIAEDLIGTLISKGVIAETDLPTSAKTKIAERQELRTALADITVD